MRILKESPYLRTDPQRIERAATWECIVGVNLQIAGTELKFGADAASQDEDLEDIIRVVTSNDQIIKPDIVSNDTQQVWPE